jgi:serine/threonine-protein kinase
VSNDDVPTRLKSSLADRYRIERELGAGGMATVYLAQDLKHDRRVAIKVLKPELAAVLGAERFVVEIKTTASLQHPHILPLFDSGTADGFLYYVMPYIEGETIREKLNRETQFGVDEAIRIAREVADALDYAHRHGVIHRDIKPENILLHDGRSMVMDFGIALAVSAAAGGRMTETGLSLGTPHYMSPEQATAEKEITPRSDVYSLASVLYETLAGQPPHIGGSAQQVIMKILTEESAPVSAMRKNVPPNVAAALAKALEKIPADRFESAKAFAEALANPAFTTGVDTARVATVPRARLGVWIPTALAALLAIALVASLARRPAAAPAKPMRFSIARSTNPEDFQQGLSISPDGKVVAYLANVGGVTRAYRRALGDITTETIRGTEGAVEVALSPDGKSVAIESADYNLKIVPFDGGKSRPVIKTTWPAGMSWSAKHGLVLGMPSFSRTIHGLTRVAESGDTALSIVTTPEGDGMHHIPHVLDDDETVLFVDIPTRARGRSTHELGVGTLSGKNWESRDLPLDDIAGVANGILVYLNAPGVLMAVRFDRASRRPVGAPVRVDHAPDGVMEAAMASDGTLAMRVQSNRYQVALVNEHGEGQVLLPDTIWSIVPRFSPDGKRVALGAPMRGGTPGSSVWMLNLADRTISRTGLVGDRGLDWTHDGSRIAALGREPRWQRADAADSAVRIPGTEANSFYSLALSPDGSSMALVTGFGEGGFNVMMRKIGDTVNIPLVATDANEYAPRFSRDGHWLAYTSDESGRPEVYVRPFPGNGPRVQISTDGGNQAVWSGDSRRIFYRIGSAFMAADVAASGGSLTVTSRRKLFEGSYYGPDQLALAATYDVSPDGHNFLVGRAIGDGADEIVVWTGWLSELEAQLARRP